MRFTSFFAFLRPLKAALARSDSGNRIFSPRSVFCVSFVAFFLLTLMWALSNPLTASPDEQSHIKKAAATAYGQVFNSELLADRMVSIPEFYHDVEAYTCNAFEPDLPISACDLSRLTTKEHPDGWVTVPTPAARYNPLYYAAVGWPALIFHNATGVYLMRTLSGLLGSLFLAIGFRALRQAKISAIGFITATGFITPMVPFLMSSVNPQALEITAAFALWCELLLIIRATPMSAVGPRMWLLAFIASAFTNSRGLTPFFLALMVMGAVSLQPWNFSRRVIKNRRSWAPMATIFIVTIVGSVWILTTGVLTSEEPPPDTAVTPRWLAIYTLRQTDTYLQQAIGSFGWLHAPLPLSLTAVFIAAGLCMLATIYAVASRRERFVVFSSLVLYALVVPVALHASQARTLGIMWQGRYILPLLIGVPILAAFVLSEKVLPSTQVNHRLLRFWALLFGAVHAYSVIFEMHRQMLGINGSWDLSESAWFPPIPLWLLALVLSVVLYLLVVLFDRAPENAENTTP
ncbi:DUF2142 domain-containing protein [Schaalia suimastitidis]|uniref:DUF2142 domain-containing protein n=1 Tax=Schaalia suimastitidis TaxID=121163 RepID=UPI00041D303D|nr:DUF2142 domain-containing protein [Schaalia suimastitidis]